jgi:hypothetical protein
MPATTAVTGRIGTTTCRSSSRRRHFADSTVAVNVSSASLASSAGCREIDPMYSHREAPYAARPAVSASSSSTTVTSSSGSDRPFHTVCGIRATTTRPITPTNA